LKFFFLLNFLRALRNNLIVLKPYLFSFPSMLKSKTTDRCSIVRTKFSNQQSSNLFVKNWPLENLTNFSSPHFLFSLLVKNIFKKAVLLCLLFYFAKLSIADENICYQRSMKSTQLEFISLSVLLQDFKQVFYQCLAPCREK
jgi:hypothetical protein